jgi:hypothetical protein
MVVREMKIGDGTIAYRGESRGYWSEVPTHLWRARLLAKLGLVAVGLLVLAYAVSPLAGH